MNLLVIAKEPKPGQVKTRLTPPLSPVDAADLAAAALHDTLGAVASARADRRVIVLEGRPGPWIPDRFEVVAQRGGGLDERLAAAFDDAGAPALLVGMDTPQLTAALLDGATDRLGARDVDAVLGRTPDGGYWAIGLKRADERVFLGLPMSTNTTGARQLLRLHVLGLRVGMLPPLRDVDYYEDAVAMARSNPDTHFARALRALQTPQVCKVPMSRLEGMNPRFRLAP